MVSVTVFRMVVWLVCLVEHLLYDIHEISKANLCSYTGERHNDYLWDVTIHNDIPQNKKVCVFLWHL